MARNASYRHLQDPLRPFGTMTVVQLCVWLLFVGGAIVFAVWVAPWLGVPGSWTLAISGTVALLPWGVAKGVSGQEGGSVRVVGDLFGWLNSEKHYSPGAELVEGYVVLRPVVESCGLVASGGPGGWDEIEEAWDE